MTFITTPRFGNAGSVSRPKSGISKEQKKLQVRGERRGLRVELQRALLLGRFLIHTISKIAPLLLIKSNISASLLLPKRYWHRPSFANSSRILSPKNITKITAIYLWKVLATISPGNGSFINDRNN